MTGIETGSPASRGAAAEHGEPITARVVLGICFVVLTAELAAASALMVATALPHLAAEFDKSDVSWTFTSSALFAAVIVGVVGKAADLYGKRLVFVALTVISVLGSIVSAVAPNYEVFISGRALQGTTYVLLAMGVSLIRDVFPKRAVVVAISIVATGTAIFNVISPFAAGWLTDSFGVLSIFWAMALMAAVGAIGVMAFVPESPIRVQARLNLVAALLLGAGTGVLIYALGNGQAWGWSSAKFIGYIVGGLACYTAWIVWDMRFSDPLIDFKLLRSRGMLWTLIATICVYALFNPIVSVIPSMLQTPEGVAGGYGFGLTANDVALFQIPFAVLLMGTGVVMGLMSKRWGVKIPFAVGMTLVATSLLILSELPTGDVEMLGLLGVLGLGFGLCFSALPNLLVQSAPMDRQGIAAVMQNVVSNIAASSFLQVTFTALAANAVVVDGGYYYSGPDFTLAYRALAVVAVIGVVVGVLLPLGRRRDVLGMTAGSSDAVSMAEEINESAAVTGPGGSGASGR